MNKLKAVAAALILGGSIYAADGEAVLIIANGPDQIEWRIGEPVQPIDVFTEHFTVVACGAELAWVYENFPTVPRRALAAGAIASKRAAVAQPLSEEQCVFWRGDNARFIADNLDVETHW